MPELCYEVNEDHQYKTYAKTCFFKGHDATRPTFVVVLVFVWNMEPDVFLVLVLFENT